MSLRKLTQVPVEAPPNGLQGACSLDSVVFNVFKVSKSYEFNTLKDGTSAFHPGGGHHHGDTSLTHEPIEEGKTALARQGMRDRRPFDRCWIVKGEVPRGPKHDPTSSEARRGWLGTDHRHSR
ncbi:MAG: hypothetical protein ABW200_13575 [Hyphomicrobiaceae bacterium]